jgi:hypothetical protein
VASGRVGFGGAVQEVRRVKKEEMHMDMHMDMKVTHKRRSTRVQECNECSQEYYVYASCMCMGAHYWTVPCEP